MSRQSAIDHHTRSASRAVASAKCFKTMAAHFGELSALSKAMDAGPADILQSIGGECSAMADGCTDDAEFHVNAAKQLSAASKSMLADERDDMIPTEVSAIAPTAPPNANRQVYRAIPRHGAPAAASVPDVADEFSKIFAIDDDN